MYFTPWYSRLYFVKCGFQQLNLKINSKNRYKGVATTNITTKRKPFPDIFGIFLQIGRFPEPEFLEGLKNL